MNTTHSLSHLKPLLLLFLSTLLPILITSTESQEQQITFKSSTPRNASQSEDYDLKHVTLTLFTPKTNGTLSLCGHEEGECVAGLYRTPSGSSSKKASKTVYNCVDDDGISITYVDDEDDENNNSGEKHKNDDENINVNATSTYKVKFSIPLIPDDENTSEKYSVSQAYKFELPENSLCYHTNSDNDNNNAIVPNDDATYPATKQTIYFTTAPPIKPDAPTGNTTVLPNLITVYGLGIFVTDISSIDLSKSLFYSDIRIFLLKYYRNFATLSEAQEHTMDAEGKCNFGNGDEADKWVYLSNVTKDGMSEQSFLQMVNIGNLPKISPVIRYPGADEATSEVTSDGTSTSINTNEFKAYSKSDNGQLDHIRIQSNWYFPPSLYDYPFSKQKLPMVFELPGSTVHTDSVGQALCFIERFSGFSAGLNSFADSYEYDDKDDDGSDSGKNKLLVADVTVSTDFNYPPFPVGHELPQGFPVDILPLRPTPRVTFMITYSNKLPYSLVLLLPSIMILITSLIVFLALPVEKVEVKLGALTTSLLSSVLQHGSLRQNIPMQSPVTKADVIMCIVYLSVMACIVSTGISALLLRRNRQYSLGSVWSYATVDRYTRHLPISAQTLFLYLFESHPLTITKAFSMMFVWIIAFIFACVLQFYYDKFTSKWSGWGGRGGGSGGDIGRFQSKEVTEWTTRDVCAWLNTLSSSRTFQTDLHQVLYQQKIDGKVLRALRIEDLRSFGVAYGTAVGFVKEVEALFFNGGGNFGGGNFGGGGFYGDENENDVMVTLTGESPSVTSNGGKREGNNSKKKKKMEKDEVEMRDMSYNSTEPLLRKIGRIGGGNGDRYDGGDDVNGFKSKSSYNKSSSSNNGGAKSSGKAIGKSSSYLNLLDVDLDLEF